MVCVNNQSYKICKKIHDKIMSMCYNEKRREKFHVDENGGNHEITECYKYSEVFRP